MRREACPRAGQRGATLLGLAFAIPQVFRSCPCNVFGGLKNRVLPPRPPGFGEDHACEPSVRSAAKALGKAARLSYGRYRTEYCRSEWYKRWPQAKRVALRQARRDAVPLSQQFDRGTREVLEAELKALLDAEGVVWEMPASARMVNGRRPAISMLKAMIKREVNILMPDKYPAKPRIIQFYKYLEEQERFAPHMYAFQKAICAAMDPVYGFEFRPGFRVSVASGLNQQQVGDWFARSTLWAGPHRIFAECDGVTWDATMGHLCAIIELTTMAAMGVEPEFYRSVRDTQECISQCRFRGVRGCGSSYDFTWKLKHTTKSGHNNTTARNCDANAVFTALALEAALPVGYEAWTLVIGDDAISVIKPTGSLEDSELVELNGRVVEELKRFGVVPECTLFNSDQEACVEFASGVFMPCIGPDGLPSYIHITKLGKALAKAMYTDKHVPPKRRDAFRRAIALGFYNLTANLPVYREFYAANNDGQPLDARVVPRKFMPYAERVVQYDRDAVAEFFVKRYKAPLTEFDQLQRVILEHALQVGVIGNALAERVIAFDTAGPDVRVCRSFPADHRRCMPHLYEVPDGEV